MRMQVVILLAGLAGAAQAAEPVVAYRITDAAEIAESLTGEIGDPERGRIVYTENQRAGCPACHGIPGARDAGDDPKLEAAPRLAGVGARLNPGALRLWIVAPEVFNPGTTMPAYYAPGQRKDPDDPLYGGPALTAGEIEDLVAYLASLTTPD